MVWNSTAATTKLPPVCLKMLIKIPSHTMPTSQFGGKRKVCQVNVNFAQTDPLACSKSQAWVRLVVGAWLVEMEVVKNECHERRQGEFQWHEGWERLCAPVGCGRLCVCRFGEVKTIKEYPSIRMVLQVESAVRPKPKNSHMENYGGKAIIHTP